MYYPNVFFISYTSISGMFLNLYHVFCSNLDTMRGEPWALNPKSGENEVKDYVNVFVPNNALALFIIEYKL